MSRINTATINLVKSFEGLSLKAYHDSIDPIGCDTIGYGSITYEDGTPVRVGDPDITEERAVQLLMWELQQKEPHLAEMVTADINDNQFGALLSFSYNEGLGAFETSTLRHKVNTNPADPSIQVEFSKWDIASGKPVDGLLRRRKAEWQLYSTPVN